MSAPPDTTRPAPDAGLPEGALLIVAAAAIVGTMLAVPAVLAAALALLRRVIGVPMRWFIPACTALVMPLLVVDVSAALDGYLAGAPVWRITDAADRDLSAWFSGVLPLALPVAGVLALGGELWHAWHSPFWDRDRGAHATLTERVRRRRMRRHLAAPARADRGVELGVDERGRMVEVASAELVQHALVVGATGAGKTTTLMRIAQSLAAQGAALVVIDLKADPDFTHALTKLAARHERECRVWSLNGPTLWNPLAVGDASELADKLVALELWTEPHYKRAAQRYLHTLLAALLAAGRVPDIGQVVELLHVSRLRAFAAQHLDAEHATRVNAYLHALDPSSMSAGAGLANRLALLAETTAGQYLAPPPPAADDDGDAGDDADRLAEAPVLVLDAAMSSGAVTVFALDSQRYGETAAQVASLAILDLKTVVGRRLSRGERSSVFVLVDEFSAIGADHIASLLARARGAGVGVILATQELADLSRVDPGFCDQVLGNTNVKIVHRQDVPESAERLAAVAGTQPGYQETLQTERTPLHMLGSSRVGGRVGSHTGVGTIREVERFKVHPNTLKALAQGEAVVIRKYPRVRIDRVQIALPVREVPQ